MIAILIVKIRWLSFQLFIINICMCVAVILIGVAQCVSPGSFNQWHTMQRNISLFCALLNIKPFHKKIEL